MMMLHRVCLEVMSQEVSSPWIGQDALLFVGGVHQEGVHGSPDEEAARDHEADVDRPRPHWCSLLSLHHCSCLLT